MISEVFRTPRIAVVVYSTSRPGSSRERYLLEAVESVLKQTVHKDSVEVVVCKSVASPEIDSQIERMGVTVYVNSQISEGARRIEAVRRSRAPLVAFLSDDDMYSRTRVADVLAVFDKWPRTGYYRNSLRHIGPGGEPLDPSVVRSHIQRRQTLSGAVPRNLYCFESKVTESYLKGWLTCESSVVLRRDVIEQSAGFLARCDASLDDALLVAAVNSSLDFFLDPRELTLYRHHTSNRTKDISRDTAREAARRFIRAELFGAGYAKLAAAQEWVGSRLALVGGIRARVSRRDEISRLARWIRAGLRRPLGSGALLTAVDLMEGWSAICYVIYPKFIRSLLLGQS